MNTTAHARLAPSAAYTWIECAASMAAQEGQPDESSEYADEGTAAHILMKRCFDDDTDTQACLGDVIRVGEREFEVDEDMAEYVQLFVDAVRDRVRALELAGAEVTMHVEVSLSIEHITGEAGARGTSDVVLIAYWPKDGRAEEEVWDLKFGRGVEVQAEWNYQAMIYAAAADAEYAIVHEFDGINIVIHQPRVNPTPNEWRVSPEELYDWIDLVAKPAAQRATQIAARPELPTLEEYKPGEKQCRFCKAKAACPALAKHVETTIGREFEALADGAELFSPDLLSNQSLGLIYPALPLIESWAKAVLARIEHELFAGNAVPGTKLVQGRRGARQWESHDDAEKLLKGMRLKSDQMYNFKLISPTQAEKLLAKESPRRWKKVEAMITQRDGSPSVAPESDKRPALVIAPPEDDFAAVDDGDDLT